MQWKMMEFPVLVDALDRLEVGVVPITLLVDEYGRVHRRVGRQEDPRAAVKAFLAEEIEKPESYRKSVNKAERNRLRGQAEQLLLTGGDSKLDAAVEGFESAIRSNPEDAWAWFRLGVALRARFDSTQDRSSDFGDAVDAWTQALELDPNNYIWRRRLQQYGPRLEKPYPFYDWVREARFQISARGDTPAPLVVEPIGAELAAPASDFVAAGPVDPPDPKGRVRRDDGRFVKVEVVTVPAKVPPGGTVRVHLEMRPNESADAHWNNEAKGLTVWIDPPEGWDADRRSIRIQNPMEAVSDEPRRVEFELVVAADAAGSMVIPGYALFYVCEGVQGQCLYRRRDLQIEIPVE